MMKIWQSFILLILLGCHSQAFAAIRPSFLLEDSAWNATEIVVATEGVAIDGKLQILEVWKGGLRIGGNLSVSEMAAFAPESKRAVSTVFEQKNEKPAVYVTGSRLVLFLKKPMKDFEKWQPVNFFNDMNSSVVWIEQDKAYSFLQVMNPGPSALTLLHLSAEEMRTQTDKILQTQAALTKVSSLKNPTQRAQDLRRFVSSPYYFARQEAFTELSKCGKAALPVLRSMLNDKSLLPQHNHVIKALGKAGGKSVGSELTRIVTIETKFWKKTAPTLKEGWWNEVGLTPSQTETLRNRYSKVLSTLYALKTMKYSGSKTAVTQLRDFWRSLPQLESKSGLNQMSEECDNVLKALSADEGQ